MEELEQSFDALMDAQLWTRVAATLAGYFAPTVLQNLAGGIVPAVADEKEVYGLAVVAGGQMAPQYSTEISAGGGMYTLEAATERFGVKETIVNAGA